MGALGTIKKDMENYSNKMPGNINICGRREKRDETVSKHLAMDVDNKSEEERNLSQGTQGYEANQNLEGLRTTNVLRRRRT